MLGRRTQAMLSHGGSSPVPAKHEYAAKRNYGGFADSTRGTAGKLLHAPDCSVARAMHAMLAQASGSTQCIAPPCGALHGATSTRGGGAVK
mmetsp:Transcript_40789/g.118180  ORF Transcript_40789/g.118180 Transcript_40789/m.118180 type:complete len:91 (+) Transcript_40789:13-285(+)